MGQPAVKAGVVDIGTNSIRLLITDGHEERGRWVEVTGLGRGVDATGRLSDEGVSATLHVLADYRRRLEEEGVERRLALATSASRDASNRDEFFDEVAHVLGVRPTLVTGQREGELAFIGATADFDLEEPLVVSDIGGGSTEFVTKELAVSTDIGSVRLTERVLERRPPQPGELEVASELVAGLFAEIDVGAAGSLIGVAGTWTSLAAIAQHHQGRREPLHGMRLGIADVRQLISRLRVLTVEETETVPGLDPKRAPVILSGAVIAAGVMVALDVEEAVISERDTLDGAAMELIGIA